MKTLALISLLLCSVPAKLAEDTPPIPAVDAGVKAPSNSERKAMLHDRIKEVATRIAAKYDAKVTVKAVWMAAVVAPGDAALAIYEQEIEVPVLTDGGIKFERAKKTFGLFFYTVTTPTDLVGEIKCLPEDFHLDAP